MSKRKHKNRRDENNNSANGNNNQGNRQQGFNNPFGINPNQLLSMFGNIDMNQINSMLQSMNTEGFDFNNFNLGSIQNLMNGNARPPQQARGQQTNVSKSSRENNIEVEDENIQMLRALRSIVNADRIEFIDKVIKLYNEGGFDD